MTKQEPLRLWVAQGYSGNKTLADVGREGSPRWGQSTFEGKGSLEWGTQASSVSLLARRPFSVSLPSSAADMVSMVCCLQGLLEGQVGAKGALGKGVLQGTSQASCWSKPLTGDSRAHMGSRPVL